MQEAINLLITERDRLAKVTAAIDRSILELRGAQADPGTEIIETTLKRRGRPPGVKKESAPAQAGERKGRTWTAKQKAEQSAKRHAAHAKRKRAEKKAAKQREEPEVLPRPSRTSLTELYKTKEFQEGHKKALAGDGDKKPKRGRPAGSKNKPVPPVLPETMPEPVVIPEEPDQRVQEEVTA